LRDRQTERTTDILIGIFPWATLHTWSQRIFGFIVFGYRNVHFIVVVVVIGNSYVMSVDRVQ